MLVTCRGCKTKIDKDKAFIHEHISKSGKKTNYYYCSKNEYESIQKEKRFYKECQYLLDDLFNETIVDNTRNKNLSELNKSGYSYEMIYNCIDDNRSKIENALVIKRDDFSSKNGMYMKLAYVFGIIKNEISKYEHETIDKKINSDTLDPSEVYHSTRKVKQEKRSLMDIINGGSNGK
ncbi:hypothetical protein [Terrisporobacter sp.]|uniref:hypothetical protein n=1 Tax=Terrisporobacter sp. TaxID=1965305 RepID=UPI0028969C53|nr:hypothetical protein [Terrisporobacter sp.]